VCASIDDHDFLDPAHSTRDKQGLEESDKTLDSCPGFEEADSPGSCQPSVYMDAEESEPIKGEAGWEGANQRPKRQRRRPLAVHNDDDTNGSEEVDSGGRRAHRKKAINNGGAPVFQFTHYAAGPGGEFYCRYPGCLYADSFRSLANCKNHQLAQHATPAEKVYACDDAAAGGCGERFASRRLLTRHVNAAHNMRFACEVCGRKFSERTRLRIHSRVHNGEKPFVCEQCGYSCSQRDNLKKHKGKSEMSQFCLSQEFFSF
jgi:uncharacterized C2H2 Zn-finger protein